MKGTLNISYEVELYQIVYLKVDTEQKPRQVIGYRIDDNSTMYIVKSAYGEDTCYFGELATEKNVLIGTDN